MRFAVRRTRETSGTLKRRGLPGAWILAGGWLLLAPHLADAQHQQTHEGAGQSVSGTGPSMEHMDHMDHMDHAVTKQAREQIAAVERAVAPLKTPAAAAAAGFMPFLGMLPTMGMHDVNQARILDSVKLLEPDVLMFSPVDGEQRLVGVAYGFLGDPAQAPDLFDGPEDMWHDHPEFAPPGQTLVMLHVWFVPSPDGPFAGHNPWLPYWAAGLQPPPDSVMREPVAATRARRLALALAEAAEPLPRALTQMGAAGLELVPGVAERRDSLQAIVPQLKSAQRAADQAAWDRGADAAIGIWERIRDAYLDAIPVQELRDRLAKFYREMETGQHEH